MRIFGIIFILLLASASISHAQKFGYIDSEYILNKMPEYKKAQTELDQFSRKWQKEIEDMQVKIDELEKSYAAEEVLLTEDMQKERLDTIFAKKKALRDHQKSVFGYEGIYFLKKQELMKPIQDKLYAAVEKVAEKYKLQFVFDKSSDLVVIYSKPIHDYSDYVLEELGLGDKNDTIQN
jgi:outer membrane protein